MAGSQIERALSLLESLTRDARGMQMQALADSARDGAPLLSALLGMLRDPALRAWMRSVTSVKTGCMGQLSSNQVKPSRAINADDAAGPQLPAG